MTKIGKRYQIKDGKIVPVEKGMSVSARLRQRLSKKLKVVSPAKARAATKAQRP
jgi:hypothetical protein